MRVRKVIHKPVNVNRDGVNLVGGIDAVISANIQSRKGDTNVVSSHQVHRIVQQGNKSRKDPGRSPNKEVEP